MSPRRARRGATLAIVSAIAIGAVAIGGGPASGDSQREDDDKRSNIETIVLIAKGDQFTTQDTLDLGADGLSQGDRFVFNDDLFRNGKRVGFDGGECTVVRKGDAPGAASYHCVYTLVLPGGQITVQGLFTENEVGGRQRTVSFAITGGTKRYRNVRGELLDERLNPTTFRYTLRLITRKG